MVYGYFISNAGGNWLKLHAGMHALKALIGNCSYELIHQNLDCNMSPLLDLMSRKEGKVRLVTA